MADVLVVDDDRKTVDLIRLYLEREGYRVRVAYDGGQALAAVRDLAPELIVLDLMLPRSTVWTSARHRRESAVPI